MHNERNAEKRKGGNKSAQMWADLHTCFYEMNLIEQIEWLNAAKRTHFIRIRNWIIHIIILAIFISSIIIVLTSPDRIDDYLICIAGGYIFAIDFYALKWIGEKLIHDE